MEKLTADEQREIDELAVTLAKSYGDSLDSVQSRITERMIKVYRDGDLDRLRVYSVFDAVNVFALQCLDKGVDALRSQGITQTARLLNESVLTDYVELTRYFARLSGLFFNPPERCEEILLVLLREPDGTPYLHHLIHDRMISDIDVLQEAYKEARAHPLPLSEGAL